MIKDKIKKAHGLKKAELMDPEVVKTVFDGEEGDRKALLNIYYALKARQKAVRAVEANTIIADAYKAAAGITEDDILDKTKNGAKLNHGKVYDILKTIVDFIYLDDAPYIYEHGVYVKDADYKATRGARIAGLIRMLIPPGYIRHSTLKEIYSLMYTDQSIVVRREDINNYPDTWINFQNGFYDCKTGVFKPHSPEWLSINQIPRVYDPNRNFSDAEKKTLEDFLNYALYKPGQKAILLEFFGYALTPSNRQQVFMVLTGSGGNGKSILLALFKALLGAGNLTHLTIDDITSNRFSSARMFGKLGNACGDLKTKTIREVANLKRVTGDDDITAENKGETSFEMKSYAKLIFAMNGGLRFEGEETDAVFRRTLPLCIDRKPKEADPDLKDKVLKQIDYFTHICVQAHREQLNRPKQRFTHCQDCIDNIARARTDSNSTDAWIADRCEKIDGAKTSRAVLYLSYKAYCESEGREPKSNQNFYKALRDKGFIVDKKINGERYVEGLTVKEDIEDIRQTVEEIGSETVPIPEYMSEQIQQIQWNQYGQKAVSPAEAADMIVQIKQQREINKIVIKQCLEQIQKMDQTIEKLEDIIQKGGKIA